MGINCEIGLHKTKDGVFKPGSIVAGAVKYAVDEETQFTKITLSIKGKGSLDVTKLATHKYDPYRFCYRKEQYVDEHYDITNNEKGLTVPIGMYEKQFSFKLPMNIPQSFKFNKTFSNYDVTCKIVYYIRIKFERSGFMKRNKSYKKDIEVVALVTPRLSMEPCIYGARKTLTQIFARNENVVELKANITNSVISPGGKIHVNYELNNDSNVTVNKVKVKLCEVHKFFCHDYVAEKFKAVKDTDSKTGSVKSGETQNMDIEIDIPADIKGSLEYSKLVSREYFVKFSVGLPMSHRDIKLQIPVQIIDTTVGNDESNTVTTVDDNIDELPPSYWEVMGECNDDDEKGEKSK